MTGPHPPEPVGHDPATALDLAWALRHRDRATSARLLAEAQAALATSDDGVLTARARTVQAAHAFLQQDYEQALGLAQEALGAMPQDAWLGRLLLVLGNVCAEIGEPAQAADYVGRAVEVGRRAGDAQLVAQVLLNASLDQVDATAQVRDVHRALSALEGVGDVEGQAYARLHLAQVLADARRHHEAALEARRAQEAAAAAGSHDVLVHALALDALVSARLGRRPRAHSLLARVRSELEGARDQLRLEATIEAAAVHTTLGEHGEAVALLEPWAGSSTLSPRQAIALTDLLAEGYAVVGDHESAYWTLRSHVEARGAHEDDTARRRAAALVVLHRVRDVEREAARAREAQRQLEARVAELRTERREAVEISIRDELTGLHNRRLLNQRLRQDVAAATPERPVSLLLLDLDRFKAVNDTHGHVVGDQVLHELGRVLGSGVRSTDVAARYGGEELAVLQPGTDLAAAAALAERLRAQVRGTDWEGVLGTRLGVTVSVGVSTTTGGETPADLLRRADRALYAAKAAGRDRVATVPPPAAAPPPAPGSG